jgi:site-specific DNA-methyltransferase (adenine-specific)
MISNSDKLKVTMIGTNPQVPHVYFKGKIRKAALDSEGGLVIRQVKSAGKRQVMVLACVQYRGHCGGKTKAANRKAANSNSAPKQLQVISNVKQFETGKLYKGECLDVMAKLPSQSVDMILCDLPYGCTDMSWDKIIPFEELWEAYWRLLKPNGSVVLTATQPFSSQLIMSQLEHFKYNWIWKKSRPSVHVHAKNRPMGNYEDVCVFSRSDISYNAKNRMVYKPQGLVEIEPIIRNGHKKGGESVYRSRPSHGLYKQTHTNYPRQVLEFQSEIKTIHPTQKPVDLMAYLIETYTEAGSVVLDNCIGSGTTAIAAIKTNRRWIGIEMTEKYYDLAVDRISNSDCGMEMAA